MLNRIERYGLVALLWLTTLAVKVHLSTSDVVDVVLTVGENITFAGCNFSANSLFSTLTYTSPNTSTRIAYTRPPTPLAVSELYTHRILLSEGGFLVLLNVGFYDRGRYKCVVNPIADEKPIEDEIELKVGVCPLIQPLPLLTMLEGSSREITCNATGVPIPQIKWFKNTTLVGSAPVLRITDVKPLDFNSYRCHAENDMGSDRRSLEIKVYEKPRVREFYHNGDLETGMFECQNVSFFCEPYSNESANKVQSLRFYHNGRLVKNNSKSGVYSICRVQKEHQGNYTCVPVSKYGVGINKTIWLTVIDAEENCKKAAETPPTEISTTSQQLRNITTPSPLGTSGHGSSHHHANRCLYITIAVCLTRLFFGRR